MRHKSEEIELAIELRKKGHSYRDILSKVPLAKSTLSKWLKDLPLTEVEKDYLKGRRDSNISRGRIKAAAANHQRKVERDRVVFLEAREEFQNLLSDSLFQVGIALYWAEGAKRNQSFAFTNSDPEMVVLMIGWIKKYLKANPEEIRLRLYIHKPYAHENCEEYWSLATGIPLIQFAKTSYKPTSLLIKKRPNYKGCVRIELGKVNYLRKLTFWQQMLIEHYRK